MNFRPPGPEPGALTRLRYAPKHRAAGDGIPATAKIVTPPGLPRQTVVPFSFVFSRCRSALPVVPYHPVAWRTVGGEGYFRPAPGGDQEEPEGYSLGAEGPDVGDVPVDVADDEGVADHPHPPAELPVEEGCVVDGHAEAVLEIGGAHVEHDGILVA